MTSELKEKTVCRVCSRRFDTLQEFVNHFNEYHLYGCEKIEARSK
jgi:hypothetical protein